MLKPLLLMLLVIPLISFCQDNASCVNYHDGTFYYYPKNSNKQYISIRSGSVLKEVEIGKTDTSAWSLKWNKACTYELKFQSGGSIKGADRQFVTEHSLVYSIAGFTRDYYTMEGFIDKVNYMYLVRDTIWLAPRARTDNREIFTLIANEGILKKQRFRDTSAYAVLYIYRSKKINQMLNSYPVYIDENLLFVAQNNSSAIYKILKEGPASFSAAFEKNKSNATIDFKFGKKYFLKCDIHIGLYSKPDLKIPDEEKGREEYDNIGQ